MTDVPDTVATALADRPVAGRTCLEAGAGAGNATLGLLDAGAERVYAVTNDREHARTVRTRLAESNVAREAPGDAVVVETDLRETPLPDDAVDVVVAHALCNVLAPPDLATVAADLTRVAAPGAHLVVDDYAPLPDDAAVAELFAVENAVARLATGEPALSFRSADHLRRLFAGFGWTHDRTTTLLDPVPWTADLLEAHREVVAECADAIDTELSSDIDDDLPGDIDDDLGDSLLEVADHIVAAIGAEDVGRMYSLALRLPE